MRWMYTAVAMMMATGCTAPGLTLSHMSTMDSETRGVVLYDNGQRGHAAMWDTTCEFDTLNGWIISDHDLPTETEEIQDTLDGIVLGRSDEGVHLVQDRDADVAVDGVVASRMLHDGLALVRTTHTGSCEGVVQDTRVALPDAACSPTVAVASDREQTLYLATGDEVLAVDPDGAESIDGAADLVVHDPVTGLAYVAQLEGTEVRAMDRDGAIAWTAEVPGAIHAMDDMGDRGMVALLVETAGGGAMVVLDGTTGKLVVEHPTPSADADVTVSEDGTTLGVVLTDQVFFYDVLADGEEPKKRKTLGEEEPVFSD